MIIASLAVLVVLTLVAGVLVLASIGRKATYPDEWDSRVLFAVRYIENDRGQPFVHPVEIDFLPEDEFVSTITGAKVAITDDDRRDAARQAGMLRALGLVQGDVDLLKEQSNLSGSGTAAFYSPEAKRVLVRGTDLSLTVKATLVHELTHAWQDQHYDLGRLPKLKTQQERDAFRTLAEGDAVVSENGWVAELSAADHQAYEDENRREGQTALGGMKTVPDVLIAGFEAPYQFGPPLVEAIRAKEGVAGLDARFAAPPVSDEQLMNPWKFLAGEGRPHDVAVPKTGSIEPYESGTFGSLTIYLMLADRLDPHAALAVIDGWAGDAYALTEEDGKVCVHARIEGDTPVATKALGTSLTTWATDLGQVHLTPDDAGINLDACDPGPGADLHVTQRSTKTIEIASARSLVWADQLTAGATDSQALCLGENFAMELTLDDLAAAAPLGEERLQAIRAAARSACH